MWTEFGKPHDLPIPQFSFWAAWAEACARFWEMTQNGGVWGVCILAMNYIGSFGIIVGLSLLARARWNALRVIAFEVFSTLCILGFAYPVLLRVAPQSIWLRYEGLLLDHWTWYLIGYKWYAIPVSLIVGLAVSAAPFFRPTARYWLARGMCPKCQYDLQGKTNAGCPECGWNRAAPSDGRQESPA